MISMEKFHFIDIDHFSVSKPRELLLRKKIFSSFGQKPKSMGGNVQDLNISPRSACDTLHGSLFEGL